jgi:prepilin-type N-terminal cleavage/methylation domain-containing protein/prepilin-type processing-associated H-X9-DG protein
LVRSRLGFTLIELLVVIAIIAILAAILFPVFSQARDKARQASCLSNVKQIGLGFMQYVQDFDETMPLTHYEIPGTDMFTRTIPHWQDLIYPYIKSTGVYNCPSDDFGRAVRGTNPDHNNGAYSYPPETRDPNKDFYGSFTYNQVYPYGGSSNSGPAPSFNSTGALADIGVPANTVLSVETDVTNKSSILYSGGPGWAPGPVLDLNANPPFMGFEGGYFRVVARHQKFSNVLWCDGHVKATRLEELHNRRKNGATAASAPNGALSYFTVQDD